MNSQIILKQCQKSTNLNNITIFLMLSLQAESAQLSDEIVILNI